jgi:hypothetical protein
VCPIGPLTFTRRLLGKCPIPIQYYISCMYSAPTTILLLFGGSGYDDPYGVWPQTFAQPSSSKKVSLPAAIANVCGHTVHLILCRQYTCLETLNDH